MNDAETQQIITRWVSRSQIDYADLYARLYIAYNAWYRRVTGAQSDREAIRLLKCRFVIWRDYCEGKVLHELRPYLEALSALTLQSPFVTQTGLNVSIHDAEDWKGLIDYWYRIRCELFHGSMVDSDSHHLEYVYLAYKSLNRFMLEITARMERCFDASDERRFEELTILMSAEPHKAVEHGRARHTLQQKYLQSPDLWNVDMVRV
jgi:hypothetical protein